jgi:hypothetical protein
MLSPDADPVVEVPGSFDGVGCNVSTWSLLKDIARSSISVICSFLQVARFS